MQLKSITTEKLTGIANAIRDKTGETDLISLQDMPNKIKNISTNINLQSKNITPTSSEQNIIPDSGYDGLSKVTVTGDANLVAGNIKSGVSIFGVAGSYEGNSGASVETCTVTLKMTSGYAIQSYGAVTYEDGVYGGISSNSVDSSVPVTIANVVANSLFAVYYAALEPECRIVGNAELLRRDGYLFYFRIFASAGEAVEIELYDND